MTARSKLRGKKEKRHHDPPFQFVSVHLRQLREVLGSKGLPALVYQPSYIIFSTICASREILQGLEAKVGTCERGHSSAWVIVNHRNDFSGTA